MSELMASLSDIAMFMALIGYVVALLAFAAEQALVRHRTPAPDLVTAGGPTQTAASVPPPSVLVTSRFAPRWLLGTTAVHALAVTLRGLAAGAMPLSNMYEFVAATALAVSFSYAVLAHLRPEARPLGLYVAGGLAAALGWAITSLYTEAGPLIPALKSGWLAIHVTAAVAASGAFTLGAIASALFLRAHARGTVHGLRPGQLDKLARRLHTFAFPVWTFAVIAGAIWADSAWGRYWGWDPKEVWAFITWVVYAAYLHARATRGWSPRRVALIAVTAYACLLFNLIGVNLLLNSLHSYAGL
ncbi:c-type cytochrome biogenesis protein CcsB [Nonomuraea turcica]|uniref:c-type cytochrome biogenesis protein CcsB n=1 Tax=Nonomuraea sp. G32 TaxID=3067274 RepID=UPI00273B54EB|nr:c-type cytochrome biogenesis protein CcsB [Nonomuraea sp. G32]MDP4505449.1 c-type cytochrome biogenesis protein CcsB [Nonomuraea sp. G32]